MKTRSKKVEKDSGEWESMTQESGSGLSAWSWERGQELPCEAGERDMISWRSWSNSGRKGLSDEREHVSETQSVFLERFGKPCKQTEKVTNVSMLEPELGSALSWMDRVVELPGLGPELASSKTSGGSDSVHRDKLGSSQIHDQISSMVSSIDLLGYVRV